MNEYILKQDVLNLPQSIERNLRGEIVERSIDVKDIEALKSAEDVVLVVRCKDCKFYTSMTPDIKTGICDLNVHHMGDDGFCSCGERKNDVPTNIIESLKEEINTVNRLNDRIKNRWNNG